MYTYMHAYIHTYTSVVGAGSFALPWACKNEGLIGCTVTIAVASVLSAMTIKSLINCKDQVCMYVRMRVYVCMYIDINVNVCSVGGCALGNDD